MRADSAAYGWALAACSSRAFLVRGERALVPVIDLGNHRPGAEANCQVRGTLGGSVELVACRSIQEGEEVTYCYGDLSNDAFLLDYGFVPSANSHDVVELAWGSGAVLETACATAGMPDELQAWQRAALRAMWPSGLEHLTITRDGVDGNALAACRLAAARDATAFRQAENGRKRLSPQGSETRALKIAAALVAIAMAALPPAPDSADHSGEEHTADVLLARRFMDEKRALLSEALRQLAGELKGSESRGLSRTGPSKTKSKAKQRKGKRATVTTKSNTSSRGFG